MTLSQLNQLPSSLPAPSAGARGERWPGSTLLRFARTPQGAVGLALFTAVVLVALLGPLFAPHPLAQPIGFPGSPPSSNAPLGTDFLGRDVLSRYLDGGIPVLALAAASIAGTYLLGIQLGMMAGLNQGTFLDSAIMRVVDVFIAFPPLLLLLVLISGTGSSQAVVGIGIVLVLFPGVVRIVRSATQEIATTGYVDSAILRGEKPLAIMYKEILPNIVQTILADFGIRFSSAIVLSASLNFLGLGSQPPAANWGLMVAENQLILGSNIWAAALPAATLAILAISINLMADAYTATLGRSRGTDSR
jgi:peptide/nickel transport system permease protein